jgi:RNA polymerase sigma factor (sigma-70 family)
MAFHRKTLRERVAQAALALTPAEREALVLSARDGLSNRQIAEHLGISTDAVERRLVSALCKFERELHQPRRCPWRRVFRDR